MEAAKSISCFASELADRLAHFAHARREPINVGSLLEIILKEGTVVDRSRGVARLVCREGEQGIPKVSGYVVNISIHMELKATDYLQLNLFQPVEEEGPTDSKEWGIWMARKMKMTDEELLMMYPTGIVVPFSVVDCYFCR